MTEARGVHALDTAGVGPLSRRTARGSQQGIGFVVAVIVQVDVV